MNWTDAVDLGIRVAPRKVLAMAFLALVLVFAVAPSAGHTLLREYSDAKARPFLDFANAQIARLQADVRARANDIEPSVGSPFQRAS